MDEDTKTLIRRLAVLLHASQANLDRAAVIEHRRESGKPMRQITAQKRAKAARELVAKADALVGGVLT